MLSKEFKELPPVELDRKLVELRDELVGLRLKQSSGQVENPSRFRSLRRDIARLETLKRQREIAAAATTPAIAKPVTPAAKPVAKPSFKRKPKPATTPAPAAKK
jgi:large subunit ribosomal protein L29